MTLDRAAPPTTLPAAVYAHAPRPAHVLYRQAALWALLPPPQARFQDGAMMDLLLQRLLWEVGGHLGFTHVGGHIVDVKEIHSKQSIDMEQMIKYIEDISTMKCEVSFSFRQCIEYMSKKVVERNYFDKSFDQLFQSWLSDLDTVGYTFPERVRSAPMENNGAIPETMFFTAIRRFTEVSNPS